LFTTVLAKALFPCVAKIIQAQNEFPVQECQLQIPQGRYNEAEGHISFGGRGIREPVPDKLSQRNPQTVRNKTTVVTEMDNCLSNEKFTSAEWCTCSLVQQV
jgi:hypothetical protein